MFSRGVDGDVDAIRTGSRAPPGRRIRSVSEPEPSCKGVGPGTDPHPVPSHAPSEATKWKKVPQLVLVLLIIFLEP